ncbi:MAG: DEAD/DEAH box helicase family protein, partial [Prevotella sp.]|nr:DEAD/DEAH box helicase family protein [Prevotella sp.]
MAINTSILEAIIYGRVEPHIYAFSTNTIPNYIKVGDTYRPVSVRLKEWEKYYQLTPVFDESARVDDAYFRDYAVHYYLEELGEIKHHRLQPHEIPTGVYYSKEFFEGVDPSEIGDAIKDIKSNYRSHVHKYQFYNEETLKETESWDPDSVEIHIRPNQQEVVNNFKRAYFEEGRTNLLMYAVMRFGKSYTAMRCAVEMGAKFVVIVSGKKDVMNEWGRTIVTTKGFNYDFITSDNLKDNNKLISEKLDTNKNVACFFTLADLMGDDIKAKHQDLFDAKYPIDMLIVDETHFGARAEKYGAILNTDDYENDVETKATDDTYDDFIDTEDADEVTKSLYTKTKVTIHLSGTPYRILMGNEFSEKDIIASVQFSDIIHEKEAWDAEHRFNDTYKEWDNPYYGFPQMIRFAFMPNASSRLLLSNLKDKGYTYALSKLLEPCSITKSKKGLHRKFKNEQEVLDLLEVIDGSKEDDQLLGFLDYDKIKEGNLCRHIVMVLPYKASCDAMEKLIKDNTDKFKNLNEYEILNICGHDIKKQYKNLDNIIETIERCENNNVKTLTLTVNRMLTGCTVPEWDTMIFLKDTSSPQEYDQATFRLQNRYIKCYTDQYDLINEKGEPETDILEVLDEKGKTVKVKKNKNLIYKNMKPQTILVDFDPNRMFQMQEIKSVINTEAPGGYGADNLDRAIQADLEYSPLIRLNIDKIESVNAQDVLDAVRNYQKDRGIKEEVQDIGIDLKILDIPVI